MDKPLLLNTMRVGGVEYQINAASFSVASSQQNSVNDQTSPWNFNFNGRCDDHDRLIEVFGEMGDSLYEGIGVYCEDANLPLHKQENYTGTEIYLPGFYDDESGEPYFAIDVGESYEIFNARLKFLERKGSQHLIELQGTISQNVFGESKDLHLLCWADQLPDR